MIYLFLILLVLACVVLGLIVLVQNPKGGGLSGSIGGLSNQFMGVKQTTDVLEKGTWVFSGLIAVLCISSALFIGNGTSTQTKGLLDKISTSGGSVPSQPAAAPANTTTAPADSNK